MTLTARNGVLFTMLFLAAVILFDLFFVMQSREDLGITGMVSATVNISGFAYANCSYIIPENFSLFSAYCLGTEDPAREVFGNISSFEYAFKYEPANADDPWKSYNKGLPSWVVQDLVVVSRYSGYWVRMSGPGNFSFSGIVKIENTIPLKRGWNLISYPSQNVKPANQTFGPIYGNYSQAAGYNETREEFETFIPAGENSTMNYTYPFHAYWVNSSRDQNLVIIN